jgi:DNA modification methylase
MRFSQEGHITKDYDHDTVKPEKLSKTLILTCSRPGDLVVVPFSGSGTECAMAAKEGRQFVGFETTLRHVEMSNNRVHEATRQGALFSC